MSTFVLREFYCQRFIFVEPRDSTVNYLSVRPLVGLDVV